MKILALDSCSVTASAALLENGELWCERFINNGLTHSQTLMPLVDEVLKECDVKPADLDALAITKGPGSFTGVRIGIAALKGMGDALGIPCIGVSSLEAAAQPFYNGDSLVCAVMDARCNQVYTASFYKGERLCEDKALLIDELAEELEKQNKEVLFVGDGALMCLEKLKDRLKNVNAIADDSRFIHAEAVGKLAFKNKDTAVSAQELLPFYLRLLQAERQLKLKKENKKC